MQGYCTTQAELKVEAKIVAMQSWIAWDLAFICYQTTSRLTVWRTMPIVFVDTRYYA
jgi:hypothetical protein